MRRTVVIHVRVRKYCENIIIYREAERTTLNMHKNNNPVHTHNTFAGAGAGKVLCVASRHARVRQIITHCCSSPGDSGARPVRRWPAIQRAVRLLPWL